MRCTRATTRLAEHYLEDLVCGANAVVAGVAVAQLETRIVLILGCANLLADGLSMGCE